MMYKYLFFASLLSLFSNVIEAQTGPWAKYDGKMKGEALIRESDGGYLIEVQSIVEGGGDVNWQMENSGLTPLMAAASAGKAEVVKFLLSKGANPNLKDAYGRTALQRAKLVGAKDVTTILNTYSKVAATDTSSVHIEPVSNTPVAPPPTNGSNNASIVKKSDKQGWIPFGTYGVGQKVKFFAGDWKEGTIMEVGISGNYSAKNVAPKERKYLIAREGVSNWNDWIDWGSVTGLSREDYWTNYFLGDWRLGETMAVNTRTDGVYQRDEYSFQAAKESLSVNENKTYRWKTIDGKIITGNWTAAEDGAGIILLRAYRGVDWVLRNETNAAEENIRGLQSARLTTPGKMSITAKRPL